MERFVSQLPWKMLARGSLWEAVGPQRIRTHSKVPGYQFTSFLSISITLRNLSRLSSQTWSDAGALEVITLWGAGSGSDTEEFSLLEKDADAVGFGGRRERELKQEGNKTFRQIPLLHSAGSEWCGKGNGQGLLCQGGCKDRFQSLRKGLSKHDNKSRNHSRKGWMDL